MHLACKYCDLKQVEKISNFLNLEAKLKIEITKKVKDYLADCDMDKTNPEIMKEVYALIISFFG